MDPISNMAPLLILLRGPSELVGPNYCVLALPESAGWFAVFPQFSCRQVNQFFLVGPSNILLDVSSWSLGSSKPFKKLHGAWQWKKTKTISLSSYSFILLNDCFFSHGYWWNTQKTLSLCWANSCWLNGPRQPRLWVHIDELYSKAWPFWTDSTLLV